MVRLAGDRYIVQTVDFFTPIVDDPYQFGQIAAANALSDIYAMGGTPLFALNIVGYPISKLPRETLIAILQGGIDKAATAGVSIVGGHSVDDHEPKYGLVVTGEVGANELIRNNGAQTGDILVLTKPLGTGIISTAIKKGKISDEMITPVVESMTTLNKIAADAFKGLDIHAATDVTGYGLLGHLREMCLASGVGASIHFNDLIFFDGVRKLATDDIVPGGSKRNLDFIRDDVSFPGSMTIIEKLMIADAQTSGGLLVALPASDAEQYMQRFTDHFFKPIKIGQINDQTGPLITVH